VRRRPGLDVPADEDLIAFAVTGDVRAFEMLFDRHASVSFSLAYRICRRRSMAEDVVQEAFLALWRNAGRYEPGRGSVRSWLLSIVRSRSIDALRRAALRDGRNVAEQELAEPMSAAELVEAEVLRRDDAQRIREALAGLPTEQRQVIELSYFCGLSHGEIAQALELPTGTVKGRIRLGLRKLRTVLEPATAPRDLQPYASIAH
jgi:RNA polymerase sigma-70 factor (ECF subfamily)